MPLSRLVSILAVAILLSPFPSIVDAQTPLTQEWSNSGTFLRRIGTPWNDGIERALVDAGVGIRMFNLRTGMQEGQLHPKYGSAANLVGCEIFDPAGNGELRMIVAGRANAGAPWYVGVHPLSEIPGFLLTPWETSPAALTGVRTTRVLGGPDDVVLLRPAGTGGFYIALHDGATGTLLWDQQTAGVLPAFTLTELDATGDGIPDWLLETGTGSPSSVRLMSASDTVVSAPPTTFATPGLSLGASVPNPFVGDTRIRWTLESRAEALVRVFDAAGRHVRTLARGIHAAGPHEATWDGRDEHGRALPPGIYLSEVRSGNESQARRMIRLR